MLHHPPSRLSTSHPPAHGRSRSPASRFRRDCEHTPREGGWAGVREEEADAMMRCSQGRSNAAPAAAHPHNTHTTGVYYIHTQGLGRGMVVDAPARSVMVGPLLVVIRPELPDGALLLARGTKSRLTPGHPIIRWGGRMGGWGGSEMIPRVGVWLDR